MEVEDFEEFFRQYYLTELEAAALSGKKSIIVDFSLLDKFKPELADKLLNDPENMIKAARESILSTDLLGENIKIEPRFKNLPEKFNLRIRSLRSEHIGKFLCLDGVVRRASEVKPEFDIAIYQCPECGQKMEIKQTERFLQPPVICENPECGRKGGFVLFDRRLFDARWIFIEEPFEIVTGERPGEVPVYLKEDLTIPEMQRKTDPGNRLKINCIVKETKKFIKGKLRTQMDIYVEANYVEPTEMEWEEVIITPQDEEKIKEYANDPEIYNKIVASIAPSIYGMNEIKEAVMLQLFGGVPHNLPDKTRIRGDIHILLIGDPSCLIADERVVMSDGTIMKIGEMGTEHLEDINYNLHMGMGRKVGKATKFHFFKSQPIMEIVTETGKSIKGTCNQPVLVLKDRERIWKRLDEIKINDRVCTVSKIECRKKHFVDTKWTDCSYYHKSWHIKIPKVLDESLAGIFGYIIADGWIRKRSIGFVINKDELDIAPKIINHLEKCFGVPISSYEHKRASEKVMYYEVNRTHLAKLLSFLKEKRVPNLVFQSRDSVVASFLKWLYEGDGSVFSKGRGRTSVSLRSNNIELLRDVQLLLLRFGIHSRILWENKKRMIKIKGREVISKPSGSLMIRRSESITKFSKNIGFVSQKKISKLEKAVEYAKSHVHRVHKERSEKIVKINNDFPQDVFDVEVSNYHRFVANGIIVHNTGKSQLLKLISGIIPRGKYVGGKGATAAGLTATVVKDEEFGGGWMLEAGAMILANKGILCLHPETKILINDKIVSIKNIFDENIAEKAISKGEIVEVNDKSNFSVSSFDLKNKTVLNAMSFGIGRKQYKGKMMKIKFDSGFEICLTPDHKLLDGNSFSWKASKEFSSSDSVVSPLKLLQHKTKKIYVMDIVPDEWKVCLAKEEKFELKKVILSRYRTIKDFNDKFRLNRHFLSGGLQISVGEFKGILKDLHLYEEWKNRCLKFAMSHGGNRLKTPFLTPELGYVFGFIFGDGNVSTNHRRSRISVMQSESHRKYINNLMRCWEKISERPNVHRQIMRSKIRGKEVESDCSQLYMGNRLLAEIYKKIVGEKLENLLLLDDDILRAFIAGAMDSDGCISLKNSRKKDRKYKVAHVEFLLSDRKDTNLNFILALRRLDVYSKLIEGKGVHRIRITGRKDVITLKNAIVNYSEKIRVEIPKRINLVSSTSDKLPAYPVLEICKELSNINKSVLVKRGVWSTIYDYRNLKRQPSRDQLQKLLLRLKDQLDPDLSYSIQSLLKRDFFLDAIKSIEEFDYEGYVYDIFVPSLHNFVADGVFVHNCIDEFDKMSKDDQIAMHEGLEQQQISIAKASIVATLPAQVSVLAGSNPKFFRFDPFKSIAEQVDIPDTLLSRFDLKFALKDVPDKERDEKLASHILETRLKPSLVEPLIAPEFLRKYIAYARKNSKPEMTREAAERLKNFYLDMRSLYSGEETVAITLRQNEGLMRLAEAAAKIRLSEKVEMKDADRAVNIMRFSIQQLGYDYETGKIDIDRTEGVSASQRSKIHIILDIIDMLEKKIGKPVPKEEIIAAAEDQGLKAETTEDLLRRLKSEGSIFEPKLNYLESIK